MPDKLSKVVEGLFDEVNKVVIGMESLKELLLVAAISGGHILIEGPMGTAKTTVPRTFAHAALSLPDGNGRWSTGRACTHALTTLSW